MAALNRDTVLVPAGSRSESCHRALAVQNQNPANPCGQLYGIFTLVTSVSEPSG